MGRVTWGVALPGADHAARAKGRVQPSAWASHWIDLVRRRVPLPLCLLLARKLGTVCTLQLLFGIPIHMPWTG